MKQIIIAMSLALILMSGIALAQMVPRPISVKIVSNDEVAAGMDVQIKDVNTGAIKNYVSNQFGEVMADASDLGYYRDTDTIISTIMICKDNSACVKSGVLHDALSFSFDLNGIYNICPSCPDCPSCPSCEVCKTCDICPTCPEQKTDWNWFIGAAGGLIVGLLGSIAFKNNAYKGKVKIERVPLIKGGFETRTSVYKQYTKKDGTIGYKWVIVDRKKEV